MQFLDLAADVAEIRGELDAAWNRVLVGGNYVLGPEVEGDLDGATAAGVGRVVDGVFVAAQRVGGGDEPTEVEVGDEREGGVEVGALVGVGALVIAVKMLAH